MSFHSPPSVVRVELGDGLGELRPLVTESLLENNVTLLMRSAITPELPYSAGCARMAKPLVMLPLTI